MNTLMYHRLRNLSAGVTVMASMSGAVSAQEIKKAEPVVAVSGPSALSIMQRASEHLARAQQISVKAEACQELFAENGMKVQTTKEMEIRLRRPDRLRVSIATSRPSRSLWYDGKSIALLDHRSNFYGKAPAANKVEAMISDVEDTLGVVFPLDDLALPKPFVDAASKAKSGLYLGMAKVMGRVCHHVAFQHEAIDWQAWVEDGPKPLLRKLVITYKLDEGMPQYIAHWRTSRTRTPPVATPIGTIVPNLPPGAVASIINGQTYFLYQGTYCQPVMQNGVTVYTTVKI